MLFSGFGHVEANVEANVEAKCCFGFLGCENLLERLFGEPLMSS